MKARGLSADRLTGATQEADVHELDPFDPPEFSAFTIDGPAPLVWHRQPELQRRLRILGRLAEMGPSELIHRIGRVVAKRVARGRRSAAPITLDAANATTLLPATMAEDPGAFPQRVQRRVKPGLSGSPRWGNRMKPILRAA